METFSTLGPSNRIFFDPAAHKYTNQSGKVYQSATQFIHNFVPKKDWEAIALSCSQSNKPKNAKYKGRTVASILNEWGMGKDAACERGTAFHEQKEGRRLSLSAIIREDAVIDNALYAKVIKVIDYSKFTEAIVNMSNWPDGIYSEMRIWNHEYEKAGTADTVILDGDFFEIEDYKTNKKLDFSNFFNKMLHPIQHLDDCNFIHYELQLSLYAYFLEVLTGKKCRSLKIEYHPSIFNKETDLWEVSQDRHFYDRETGEIIVGPSAPLIPCRYLKKEVLKMLNFDKNPLDL